MAFAGSIRRFHRGWSVFVGVQILLWTLSGLYFAWTDIDEIRGDHLREAPAPIALGSDWVAPSEIDFDATGQAVPESLRSLGLVEIDGRVHYRLRAADGRVVLADVRDGRIRGALAEEEAIRLARRSFAPPSEIRSVERLEAGEVGPHHEYRGGALPAWVVAFEHPSNTRVYVDAAGAVVTKHRNTGWRIFDFLWMVHTMDYVGRDDFNNPLLRGVAALALFTVVSGFLLWAWTSPRIRGRRRRPR